MESQEFADYGQFVTIDEIIDQVDVMMFLRVQHERHDSGAVFSKKDYHTQHGLTQERYDRLKETAILMHPAPVNRDVEIQLKHKTLKDASERPREVKI